MTREIKFRGICDERGTNYYGKWIHGYLGYEDSINPIEIVGDENIEDYGIYDSTTFVNVRPETIGQFTGLLDKNGKEIYEDDVVRLYYYNGDNQNQLGGEKGVDIIIFEDGCFKFKNETTKAPIGYTNLNTCRFLEVIGNIHD